ncbi:MAG: phage holin family protein [Mycobacteriaceae bacterium]
MSFTDRTTGDGVPTSVSAIPLTDPTVNASGEQSIGSLVKDATSQISTLVRAEVELAKAEVVSEVKKGLTGSFFFIAALVVLLYSSFFFFFFAAELLDEWLWRWAAFGIVFLLMVIAAVALAILGWLSVRRIRGPQKTIKSVKETQKVLPTYGQDKSASYSEAVNQAQAGIPRR